MKPFKLLIIFLSMVSGTCSSSVRVNLSMIDDTIKQGAIQEGTISVDFTAVQDFPVQKLMGETIGEVIYFSAVSTPVKTSSDSILSADVSVIFLKSPDKSSLTQSVQGFDIELILPEEIKVSPTEAGKELIFENFKVPEKTDYVFYVVLGLGVLLILIPGWFFYRKYKTRQAEKSKKKILREKLTKPSTYEEIISIWTQKDLYLREFPALESNFRNLEVELFKSMFKRNPSSDEKQQAVKSYQKFLESVRGVLDGV